MSVAREDQTFIPVGGGVTDPSRYMKIKRVSAALEEKAA